MNSCAEAVAKIFFLVSMLKNNISKEEHDLQNNTFASLLLLYIYFNVIFFDEISETIVGFFESSNAL
jgi:hypothetical protein